MIGRNLTNHASCPGHWAGCEVGREQETQRETGKGEDNRPSHVIAGRRLRKRIPNPPPNTRQNRPTDESKDELEAHKASRTTSKNRRGAARAPREGLPGPE